MKVGIKYVWTIALSASLLNTIVAVWTHNSVHAEIIGSVCGMAAGLTWIAYVKET